MKNLGLAGTLLLVLLFCGGCNLINPYAHHHAARLKKKKNDAIPVAFYGKLVAPDGTGVPGAKILVEHQWPEPIKYLFSNRSHGTASAQHLLESGPDGRFEFKSRRGGNFDIRSEYFLPVHFEGSFYEMDAEESQTQYWYYRAGSQFRSYDHSVTAETPALFHLKQSDSGSTAGAFARAKRKYGFEREDVPKYFQPIPDWFPPGNPEGFAADG